MWKIEKTHFLQLQVQQAISQTLYELGILGLAYLTRYNQYVRIRNAERTNLHDSRVVTCRVCGCMIVAVSVSMLDQYRYRHSYVRVLPSHSQSPSQLRLLTPKTRSNFLRFFEALFLASATSRNYSAPRFTRVSLVIQVVRKLTV